MPVGFHPVYSIHCAAASDRLCLKDHQIPFFYLPCGICITSLNGCTASSNLFSFLLSSYLHYNDKRSSLCITLLLLCVRQAVQSSPRTRHSASTHCKAYPVRTSRYVLESLGLRSALRGLLIYILQSTPFPFFLRILISSFYNIGQSNTCGSNLCVHCIDENISTCIECAASPVYSVLLHFSGSSRRQDTKD